MPEIIDDNPSVIDPDATVGRDIYPFAVTWCAVFGVACAAGLR